MTLKLIKTDRQSELVAEHRRVLELMKEQLERCKANNIRVGRLITQNEDLQRRLRELLEEARDGREKG
jgi:predicted phage gp36 major capsid-like protein